jgi:RNA polymerase sigma-70 factor, ECF subfamily
MSSNDSQAAFVARLERHRAILFKVAGAYCRRPADREELVAETIAHLWRAYGRFDERLRFSTWMYRIAVNVAISFYRSDTRRRRGVLASAESFLETLPAPAAPEEDKRLDILRELVEGLDALNRALMILYLEDYPQGEIAEILGISKTNVATKIARIKERFRRSLSAESNR